jgi:hypothetical protein
MNNFLCIAIILKICTEKGLMTLLLLLESDIIELTSPCLKVLSKFNPTFEHGRMARGDHELPKVSLRPNEEEDDNNNDTTTTSKTTTTKIHCSSYRLYINAPNTAFIYG